MKKYLKICNYIISIQNDLKLYVQGQKLIDWSKKIEHRAYESTQENQKTNSNALNREYYNMKQLITSHKESNNFHA